MSQDNQNSQPPSSPEPEANQSESTVEQVSQPSKKLSQKVQPAWKSVIIRTLRGTIGVLEATVEQLETEPSSGEETPSIFQKLQSGWSTALGKIRSLLPENLSAKLSDTALTGIIAGIAVVLFWTTSNIFASKPTEVAIPPTTTITTPPAEQVPPPVPSAEETPPAVEELPPPVAQTPSPVEELPPPVAQTPPAVEETPPPVAQTPPAVEETPPPVVVEEAPPPEPEPTPTLTPSPILLTPEQTLIATIENRVAEISERFGSGLIQSIQANFRTSDLTIKISEEWYNLKQSQQDKLAEEMLQRSKELDFSHLEIIDSQGRLVARNPVVGTEMIIFQRRA